MRTILAGTAAGLIVSLNVVGLILALFGANGLMTLVKYVESYTTQLGLVVMFACSFILLALAVLLRPNRWVVNTSDMPELSDYLTAYAGVFHMVHLARPEADWLFVFDDEHRNALLNLLGSYAGPRCHSFDWDDWRAAGEAINASRADDYSKLRTIGRTISVGRLQRPVKVTMLVRGARVTQLKHG